MSTPINKQRQIARCIAQTNMSNRAIGLLCDVSPTTVGEFRLRLKMSGRVWSELSTLTDRDFASALSLARNGNPKDKLIPDWEAIHEELGQRDVTLALLHEEYIQSAGDGSARTLCYSQFTERFRKWRKTQRVSMRQFHRPGEKMFCDFCGKTMTITEADTGLTYQAQVFVAVLGASGYVFVWVVKTQKIGDWLECNVKAIEFFGGVPKQLVPDNLKSAVQSHTRFSVVLNRSYVDMAEHYGCVANPARPRKPNDKGLVEVSVQIVQRWLLAPLRKRVFFSLEELREAIAPRLHWLNNKTSKKYPISRAERFERLDRPALLQLPRVRFELSQWRYNVRIPRDYHVEYGGSHYSVPYQYVSHLVDLRVTNNVLEVLLEQTRLASHTLRTSPGVSTKPEHCPISHQEHILDDPEQLLAWAQHIGEHLHEWVRQNLEQRRDFANGLKAVKSLRRWVREEQNSERVNEACEHALAYSLLGFERLKTIVLRNTDRQPRPESTAWVQDHPNVRGASYFRSTPGETSEC